VGPGRCRPAMPSDSVKAPRTDSKRSSACAISPNSWSERVRMPTRVACRARMNRHVAPGSRDESAWQAKSIRFCRSPTQYRCTHSAFGTPSESEGMCCAGVAQRDRIPERGDARYDHRPSTFRRLRGRTPDAAIVRSSWCWLGAVHLDRIAGRNRCRPGTPRLLIWRAGAAIRA